MVSHHHTRSSVSVRSDRARDGELTEMDSVYKHHPLPSMPRFMTTGVQRQMAGDSMLAYSERMREFTKARNDAAFSEESPRNGMLEVRAQHIPKWSVSSKGKKKGDVTPRRQRPMSLDELIGRPDNPALHEHTKSKRRFSVPSGVPSLSMTSLPEKDADDKRVRISFVSAADLFDLVDFSLRSKRSRDESIRLARAEDTLKLLSKAGLFKAPLKSISKPGEDSSKPADPSLLMVTGSSSPREAVHDDVTLGGEWARAERQECHPVKDVRRPAFLARKNDDDFLHLLNDPRTLDYHPHKLRTRPKRAKRMKLHRSELSVIPEDDHHRESSVHAQDVASVRMPVVPSSSSLAAIKSTRSKPSQSPRHGVEVDEYPQVKTHKESRSSNTLTKPDTDKHAHSKNSDKKELNSPAEEDDFFADFSLNGIEGTQSKHQTPRTDNSVKKTGEVSRNGRQGGNGQIAKGARVKAQKKFRKLIFLRDYPDPTCNRYS